MGILSVFKGANLQIQKKTIVLGYKTEEVLESVKAKSNLEDRLTVVTVSYK